MRKVFAHLHIPKCGGSTISDFLYRNFGSKLGNTNSLLNHFQYTSSQVSQILDHHPHLQCLTGHKLSLDLPYEREDLDLTAFTWIRDPRERFISHYFYHRNHTNIVPEAKKLPLEDYIKWALEEGNQYPYINGQCQFLSGGDLELIEKHIEDRKLILFPLEKLPASQYWLSRKYPEHFIDWRVRNKNTSKKDQRVKEEVYARIDPFIQQDLSLLKLSREMDLAEPPHTTYFSFLKEGGLSFLTRNSCYLLRKIANRIEHNSGT